ncbi:MAG: metallophosphoesterase family protein [Bulleidia sp.]
MAEEIKIGIISDTHNLLRKEVLEELSSCRVILHGGDISKPEILQELQKIAPVYAVRGNNDGEWAEGMPEILNLSIAGLSICMCHKKKDLPEDLKDTDLIVYGHSHKFELIEKKHQIFLNPGSCGPRRFTQPITMAVGYLKEGKIRIEKIEIPHKEKQ